MANRSYQTVELFGKPEKIKEVLNYVNENRITVFEDGSSAIFDDDQFVSKSFPISLCRIDSDKNIIHLETKYVPADTGDISKQFSDVGFVDYSMTEGGGEDLCIILNGNLLYSVFFNHERMDFGENETNIWETVSNTKLIKENINAAFNLINK